MPQKNLPALNPETASVLAMVERVATDPGADIGKLERMLDMQERILNKQAEMEFFSAMNKAQSKTGRISADAVNPQTRSKYASYAALDKVLRPIYSKNGLSLSFDTATSDRADHLKIICYVSHVMGYTKAYSVDMPTDGKGAKGNAVMTTTHATGAAMSYGMRYLLKMIFNVAIGEDDTDGNMPGDFDISESLKAMDAAKNLQELQKVFKEAYKSHPNPQARRQLVQAKDIKKNDLA